MASIKLAFLHQAATIPGKMSGTTLSNDKVPGLKMEWNAAEQSLDLTIKGVKAMVPFANVAIAIVADEVEDKPKKK